MTNPEKCAILVPVGTTLEPECESSLRVLADRGYSINLLKGSSQIDLARSTIASQAVIYGGFKETIWVDADVVFDPSDIEKLRSHNLPIVAGLYPKKAAVGFAGKFLETATAVDFGSTGSLIEMDYVGMGFTYVRSDVYDAIEQHFLLPRCGGGYDPAKPIVPYFIPMMGPYGDNGWCYLSEDYSFCARAKCAGFKIMADTTIRLGHIGKHTYTWDDFAKTTKMESIRFEINHQLLRDVSICPSHGR